MAGELSSLVLPWLTTWAIHGTAILALVALVARLRLVSEPVEEVLWRFALVGALGTATLQLATGGPRLAEFAVPTSLGSHPEELDATIPHAMWALTPATSADLVGSTLPAAVPQLERTAVDGAPAAGQTLGTLALGVWGALALAALGGLAGLGMRRRALRRLLDDRRPLVDGSPCRRALEALQVRCGWTRRVRLSVSGQIASPVAFGVLRPEICVPREALTGLGDAARDAMLAHELAHVMRRDPLWLELVHTLVALFPWHPLLRVARRRMRTLAEFRCDALGARWTGAVDVADCLVEVAAWLGARRTPAVAEGLVGMTVQREGLRARVDRLLDGGVGSTRDVSPAWIACGVSVAVVLLAAALPGARSRTAPAFATAEPTDVPLRIADVARPATTSGTAVVATPSRSPSPLADLIAVLDLERASLAAEVAALHAEIAPHLPDPELVALLAELDDRLVSIDRRRAALAALLSEPAESAEDATSTPSSRR